MQSLLVAEVGWRPCRQTSIAFEFGPLGNGPRPSSLPASRGCDREVDGSAVRRSDRQPNPLCGRLRCDGVNRHRRVCPRRDRRSHCLIPLFAASRWNVGQRPRSVARYLAMCKESTFRAQQLADMRQSTYALLQGSTLLREMSLLAAPIVRGETKEAGRETRPFSRIELMDDAGREPAPI